MTQDEKAMRDAIIFVPGLGREIVAQQIDTVTRKFAGALDRQADRSELKIKVIGAPEEEYGRNYRTPVRTIGIQEPGSDEYQPLVDLYEFDYRDNLTRRFHGRNPIVKALVMMALICGVWPRFILSLVRSGKGLKDQLQMLTMGGIMIAMVGYMAIMMSAAVTTVAQVADMEDISKLATLFSVDQEQTKVGVTQGTKISDAPSDNDISREGSTIVGETAESKGGEEKNGVTSPVKEAGDKSLTGEESIADSGKKTEKKETMLNGFQALVIVFAALGLFQKKSLKEVVSTIATEYVCAGNYIRMAHQKSVVLGQAAALLEHLAEKKEPYRHVHVVAYSFGTLVAIDTLFPHVQAGTRLNTISHLVTIGCPFDVVRTYWPDYFANRNRQAAVPSKWINLYAPLDVFGSNFRNDSRRGLAEKGIGIREKDTEEAVLPTSNIAYDVGMQSAQINLLDILTVKGIRIHSNYWTDEEAPEVSCFDTVAVELYGDNPLLTGEQV